MTDRYSRRGYLLCGASAAIALLGTPAAAQTVHTDAPRAALNQQSSAAPTITDIDGATTSLQLGAIRNSEMRLSGNGMLASAGANDADTGLQADADAVMSASPSSLAIADRLVSAKADALVANVQSMRNAPVSAITLRGGIGMTVGAASQAKLTVADNATAASASGNQAGNELALGGAVGTGGAIVSAQSADAGSGVSSLDSDIVSLRAAGGSGSVFHLSNNQVTATTIGNRADDALSVDIGAVAVPASKVPSSSAPAAAGDPATVDALYADLGSQSVAGKVSATAGTAPASFAFESSGALDRSTVRVDGNALAATAITNRSSHGLDLQAGSLAGAGTADGPATIANVTNIQRDQGGDLVAATNGGTGASIAGGLSWSQLDVSRNSQTVSGAANRADGNLLKVDATTIDTAPAAGHGPVGTAMTGSDGAASTTAAFSVQNVQDMTGASLIATMTANKVALAIGGAIDHSTVTAGDNEADSAATANTAVNGVSVVGTSVRSSVGLNNSQTVDGQLRSLVGTVGDRAGVTIAPTGNASASTLDVSRNSLTGAAVGNSASNSVGISAGTIGNGSGQGQSVAGTLGQGYGAAADIALANYQKVGEPAIAGSSRSGLATTVIGAFGIGGSSAIGDSQLHVDDNSQSAAVVGNSAVDRTALDAANVAASGAQAAGSGLSSSQFGDAIVTATSDMQIIVPGDLRGSSLSMTGNANHAVAVINDVDNGLAVDSAGVGPVAAPLARAEVGNLGSATITGDHVLSNAQFASGSATATARTTFASKGADGSIAGSRVDLANNEAIADVSANHAVNAVTVSGGSGADNAGLASSQMNTAGVAANSAMDAGARLTGSAAPSLDGSTAAVDGNLSQAVARGNSADNSVAFASAGATQASERPVALLAAFETDGRAPALLVNGQSNYGAITARAASDYGVPLNATASLGGGTASATGNSIVASAYGNTADNRMTVAGPGYAPVAMLVNVQANNATVSASVFGATSGGYAGLGANGMMAVTGNQVAATAIGNVAASTVTAGR